MPLLQISAEQSLSQPPQRLETIHWTPLASELTPPQKERQQTLEGWQASPTCALAFLHQQHAWLTSLALLSVPNRALQ